MLPQSFIVETRGKVVLVSTNPPNNRELATQIKERLPQKDGWTHFMFGANRALDSPQDASQMAATAERILTEP